ncbi:MAG: DUF3152 domain-containing protein, partial [Micrococcales bacterium]|nr:DUF3152 domain-containing protein [Micrococcales bacterium]
VATFGAVVLLGVAGYAVLEVRPGDASSPLASDRTVAAATTASAATSSTPTPGTRTAAPGSTQTPPDGADGESGDPTRPATLPRAGSGSTTVLTPAGSDSPRSGRRVRYTVEIEGGLGLPAEHFATTVQQVLAAPRGWESLDGVHFVNVSAQRRAQGAATDVRIILGSGSYVDRHCLPLRTMGELSCHTRGEVLLNAKRWAHGAQTYGDDVVRYRTYLVNHEVGHSIGHSHQSCPARGALAPVMVQQTKGLNGCRPWPWPVLPSPSAEASGGAEVED